MSELNDECILWDKAKAGNGYGVTSVNRKNVYVHRLAYEKAYGEIPKGLVIAHKCDTPNCYKVNHLFACTQKENLEDMKAKKRSASGDKHRSKKHPELVLTGEKVGTSKLTDEIVLSIRSMYSKGKAGVKSENSLSGIASKFGIAFQTVSKIVRRTTWKHI